MSKQLVWACNWVIPDCCILMTHISWIIKVIRSAQLSIEKLGSPSESLQRCTNHPWNIFARNFTYNVMELLFSPNHGFHHATITFISFDKKIYCNFWSKIKSLIPKFVIWMKLPWIVYQQARCRYPRAWKESAMVPCMFLHLCNHIKIILYNLYSFNRLMQNILSIVWIMHIKTIENKSY